ncbi:NPCBM/NEW2 domain-containing protein [Kutzneria chonburiensis]|uniref:NPCBM/NEW2 domain-containing protein n=1 Tax=Kutzneria chonburiensis TaxID=1483604 RepID=A0ABV6N274_9PSEU|nr:NPCBM/NEW2 domain-containing protein [Kutzneria chonburiensis]
MTAPGAQPPPEDHSLQVAKIDRSKALWVAVITGIFAVVAAGTTGYFAGRKDGSTAAPAVSTVVSVSTKTIAVSASAPGGGGSSAPATNVANGNAVSVLDLPDVGDAYTKFTKGFPYVDGKRQDNAMFARPCSAGAAYDLDGKHATFRATVAVADSTRDNVKAELTVSLDGAVQQSPFTVYKGHKADIAIDLSGGKRMVLAVSSNSICYGDDDQLVLINPLLGS